MLDVGAGTGGLLIAAARRWPSARLIGVDASASMLRLARVRLAVECPAADPDTRAWHLADAAALPLDDGSVDLVTSTFLLHQVPDRRAVLAELLRVLRPGGSLGLLDFRAGEPSLPADDLLEEVLAGHASDRPVPAPAMRAPAMPAPGEEYRSPTELRDELVTLGCSDVDVWPDELRHGWTARGYLDFKERFDAPDAFSDLGTQALATVRSGFLARSAGLPESAFTLHAGLVAALARRIS